MPLTLLTLLVPLRVWGEAGGLKKELVRKERELVELQDAIRARKERLRALGLKERSLIEAIAAMDREIKEKERALREVEERIEDLKGEVRLLKERIEGLRAKKVSLRERLKQRVVVAYKMQRGRMVDFLFTSQDLPSLERRYRYLEALARYDLNLMETYHTIQEELASEVERLRKREKGLLALKERLRDRRRELLSQKARRRKVLRTIRSNRELSLIALKEMEDASLRLTSRIEELRRRYGRGSSGRGFPSMKGSLKMPVKGTVVSFYGKRRDPRFNAPIFNKGIEIKAPMGAKVRAVYHGKVIFADWFGGYGLTMIIDHGDGYYTVFAHLSEILKKVGEEVEKGEVVALVGDTGSLKGPRLYFEIRYHGMPRDPLEWVSMR